jgi:hypothetical protein
VHAASIGDLTVPLLFGVLAVLLGVIGWSWALFWGGPVGGTAACPTSLNGTPDYPTFAKLSEIFVRVAGSFFPSPSNVTCGNWVSRLGAILAAFTTLISALMVALATLGEALTKTVARHVWRGHTIVVGDSVLARRVAAGFLSAGERVLQIVPRDAPKTLASGPTRVRLGHETGAILTVAAPRHAATIVIDVGSDVGTLGLGKSLLKALASSVQPSRTERLRRGGSATYAETLALCVGDPILSNQFFEVIDADRSAHNDAAVPLRPTIFDEGRLIARYALARDPLFVMAAARGQPRVHAVIVGFGNLGEKLLDQVMLTSMAGSLGEPRVTVLDTHAQRCEREFRARRPAVLDSLNIAFLEVAIGTDPLEDCGGSAVMNTLTEWARTDPVTAFFIAMPSDAETLRVALLLRQHCRRTGTLSAPVLYRVRSASTDLLEQPSPPPDRVNRFICMNPPDAAILKEIADPDGRDALARALHEGYLEGISKSAQADQAWVHLSETSRRANSRSADHLPAKLWTLGLDVRGLEPGEIPALDANTRARLADLCGASSTDPPPELLILAKLEHERWAIERKLDGWAYGPERNNEKKLHNLLVPWDELQKLPDEVRKDIEQVKTALRVAMQRQARPAFRARKELNQFT